jgi:ElaB/YqjD/DUF883 family membrane-anchored ribosome-binding protein
MDDEPEVIRQQMAETRSDLTRKIEALEHQVVSTVHSTTSAVTNTVESVKDAVQETVGSVKETVSDTVESVKETLDIRRQVDEHPWLMFGASVATGFTAGLLLGGRPKEGDRITDLHSRGEMFTARPPSYERGTWSRQDLEADARRSSFTASPAHEPGAAPESRGEGWLHELGQQFAPEVDKVKRMALGALGALVRDMVTRSAPPSLGQQLTGLVDDVTRKLGGEPLRGSLLDGASYDTAAGKTSRERDTFTEAHRERAAPGL